MAEKRKNTVEGVITKFPTALTMESEGGAVVFHVTPGAIGHSHAGGGAVTVQGGSGVPEPPPPADEPQRYFAYCEADHDPEMPGVDGLGHWSSGSFDACRDAFGAAGVHEDGQARVFALKNSIALGPLGGC